MFFFFFKLSHARTLSRSLLLFYKRHLFSVFSLSSVFALHPITTVSIEKELAEWDFLAFSGIAGLETRKTMGIVVVVVVKKSC